VTAILPSRWQPRSTWDPEALLELAKHIRDHGLMYPVLLFPVGSPLPPGRGVGGEGESIFELVAGERRTRAIVALALPDIPAWPSRNDHDSTLFAGLAWLPYGHPKPKDTHDLDGLVRYLARAWDHLGDERIATLLHTLVSEITAMANFHNGFELFNPLTLIAERWASAPWSVLSGGGPSWRVYDYPTDWPRPWESFRQGEDSPPPVGEGSGERSDAPQEVLYDHP
jgi:hypothetical protein